MTRRSLRLFFLVAGIGSAASAVLDVCSRQAMAASVINLDSNQTTGSTGSTYSLGYVTNTTITSATDNTVVPLANSLGATPTLTTAGLTPALIGASTVSSFGWSQASTGSSWLGPNSVGTANGVTGTPTALNASANFVSGFVPATSAPQGFYYYTTTFALTPGIYGLTGGSWLSDNQGAAIYLTNALGTFNLGMTNPTQFVTPSAYTIPSADFNSAGAGLNTLTFVVWNENYATPVPPGPHASPQGIEIQGTITAVPEPTAIAVVVSGLPLVGLFWARRRRVAV
jgi:hypothetical protein